ncbi:MAG: TIGR02757 family protein [bacterium]|nr:TIGR02757 family protein [bacterium]
MITKLELDKLAKKYETVDFIKDDPIQFPHRGKCISDIELYGFIASLFAYGNRKMFIKKLDEIFEKAEGDLLGFVKNGDFKSLKGVEYRFSKENDIIPIFNILSELYNNSKGLEELFSYAWKNKTDYQNFFQTVVDYFYARAPKTVGQGFYHMIPNPNNGGAMKRMNMFLRWMVRKPPVDLGIWDFMGVNDLLIPLDVHVARISRQMGLLTRKSNDFKAVIELTENLRKFSQNDPVKYDFAMFAFGIELNNVKKEKING